MRRWFYGLVGVGLVLVVALALRFHLNGPLRADEPTASLRPGLIVTYRDTQQPPGEYTTTEATIAFALQANEAPHPRLAADGFSARWDGQLRVLRPGKYRFSAYLRGKLRVTVDGREVLAAEHADNDGKLCQGPEVELKAGTLPLTAEFTKRPGAARVQVRWQGPGFRAEPLPHDAVGHLPQQAPARLASDRLIETGRLLAEEHRCTACHAPRGDGPARGLVNRPAPDLSRAGERLRPEWVYHWLREPRRLRPHASMPDLFDDTDAGKAEAYAVTRYLTTLGGPPRIVIDKTNPKEYRTSVARGERLFTAVGCAVCHGPTAEDKDKWPTRYPIPGLGSKTTPGELAKYLQNPLAVDPSGRMPSMLLSGQEAMDLARYLCEDDPQLPAVPVPPVADALQAFQRLESRPAEVDAFKKLPEDRQWVSLGQRLVVAQRCTSCHTVAPAGNPLPQSPAQANFEVLTQPAAHARGCLAEGGPSAAPRFAFSQDERAALRAFLASAGGGRHSPAPTHAARLTLERFNCLGCHTRDGQGGLTPELTEALRRVERAENAEAVRPPSLTGTGTKLNTPWLRQVLTQAGRARPWMALRMPQFGPANVGHLPEALAAWDGAEPTTQPHAVPFRPEYVEAGRFLVSKKAFGCVNCHDLAGIPATGTRGPDLASMQQRVRYDWYRRWLEQPQRMEPGTRMPAIFSDGESLLPGVLDGTADTQAAAMWAYLSLGSNLPLPEGLEPPKGLVLVVKDRPIILRTFMPDAGTKAIAVGYPGQVSIAFDAATCRLAYAWSGNFLDAAPVWDGRGGNPAKLLGPRFWTAPPGFPWALTDGDDPPDFAAQARDPAFGAPLPEGQVYQGPMRLHFGGYALDKTGGPVFRYRVSGPGRSEAEVRERIEPMRRPSAVGLARHFELSQPPGLSAWLCAGESVGEPQLLDASGRAVPLEVNVGAAERPAAGTLLLLPQGGDRLVLLRVGPAPAGTVWRLVRRDGRWQALLRLPASAQKRDSQLTLTIWHPYRNDPAMIRDLLHAGARE